MASAKNKVIGGAYNGYLVSSFLSNTVSLTKGSTTIDLLKSNVESYEVLNEEKKKSGTSAVMRGMGGAMLLGPVGLLAGVSAKSNNIIQVAIYFKDGRKSLLEINDKIYSKLISSLF